VVRPTRVERFHNRSETRSRMSATSSPPATAREAREAFERGAAWARSRDRANYDGSTRVGAGNATEPTSPPSSARIVGGDEVDPERTYPWMTTFDPFNCGASLVAPNKVLSAAHCDIEDWANKAVVNWHDRNDANDANAEFIKIASVDHHPLWDDGTMEYDFAIVTLAEDSAIAPVTLDFDALVGEGASEGEDLVVMGWGAIYSDGPTSEKLLEVTVPAVSFSDCDASYGGNIKGDSMFCAGRTGKDSCQGDSGGPIVRKSDLARSPHTGPHTTPFAMCTSILKDFTSRCARRSLRTLLPGASLRQAGPSPGFNPDTPRRLTTPPLTPFDATPTFARILVGRGRTPRRLARRYFGCARCCFGAKPRRRFGR
jgi:trypsin